LAPEDAGKGSELFQKAYDLIRQGIDTIPEADRTVKKMPEPPKVGGGRRGSALCWVWAAACSRAYCRISTPSAQARLNIC